MTPILVPQAKHNTKVYPASGKRSLTARNDISLNVYKGKTLGIVGERVRQIYLRAYVDAAGEPDRVEETLS